MKIKHIIPALGLVLFTSAPAASFADGVGYPIEHRSSFESGTIARNPFLPIGYSRAQPNTPQAAPKQTGIVADSFVVSSILIGDLSLAVINGKEYAVGDTVAGAGEGVQIAAIQDGEVVIRSGEQTVTALLRRR